MTKVEAQKLAQYEIAQKRLARKLGVRNNAISIHNAVSDLIVYKEEKELEQRFRRTRSN